MKKTLVTLVTVFAILLSFNASNAENQQIAPALWAAGIPSNRFQFFVSTQHCPEWCWAASIQMVLNSHGLLVSQEQVVMRIFGQLACMPGQPHHILAALSGWAPNVNGGLSNIFATPYTLNATQLVQDLINENPMIVGFMNPGGSQHAVVLTGVIYGPPGMDGSPTLRTAIIRDPWPFNPSRQEIPWNLFVTKITFLAHVYVQ